MRMETDIFIYAKDDAEETLSIVFDFTPGHHGKIGISPDFDKIPEPSSISIVSIKWVSTGSDLTKEEIDLYITDLVIDELKERGQDHVDGINSRSFDYVKWRKLSR